MRALVVTGPHRAEVQEVPDPMAGPGEVVVAVQRAGICGTDREFFTGEMQYLETHQAAYPMRIGHEWMGAVVEVGLDVDPSWVGARVTGDTMLGCRTCWRCTHGAQHVCAAREEVGIRGGRAGALADRLAVPATSLLRLPETVDDVAGALVEPGGNAFRAASAAGVGPGDRCLVLGPGTIGLLSAMFARAAGAEVHLLGITGESLAFAQQLGFEAWTRDRLPDTRWDAVIDASDDPALPALALDLVEPAGRIVYIGLAGVPSTIDTRLLALKDVTAVGVLSASLGLAATVEAYAGGRVDPRPLVAATIALEDLPAVLAGTRPAGAGPGPKIHIAI